MILNIGGGGGLPIRLIVTAPTGSAVSVTRGTTVLAANEVDGVWTFAIPSLGVWTIHATIEGQSLTQDVDISKVGQYNVTLEAPVKATLNDNDWATIKEVADESKGANYWSVGDTKQITINGKLSDGLTLSNYQTWVYIIGFDHNSAVEGTGIAFQGFKTAQTSGIDVALCDSAFNTYKTSGQWFNMNNSISNAGGWKNSPMRSTTLPLVKSSLPSDLQAVLKTTIIYSDNGGGGTDYGPNVTATQDELYLLAEFEIFGARTYANSSEQTKQQQYAYYVAGNSKIKHNHSSTATAVSWWERSVYARGPRNFCCVSAGGTADANASYWSIGFAPAFKVGGVKYTPVEYISSTGTQYIDTGFTANGNAGFAVDFSTTNAVSTSGYGSILGCINSGSNRYGIGTYPDRSGGQLCYGSEIYNPYITAGNRLQVSLLNGSIKTPNGTETVGAQTFNVGVTIAVFGRKHTDGSVDELSKTKIYALTIYDNGSLVRDFIPAKDEFGNAGLYDKVEGKFYYNAGTGSFGISEVSLDKT